MATIRKRLTKDGRVRYRGYVRLNGYPSLSKTFSRKTDARNWAESVERSMKLGDYRNQSEAGSISVAEFIDDFVADATAELKDAKTLSRRLEWWKSEIGQYSVQVIATTPRILSDCKRKLLSGKTNRGSCRNPATVNRYLAALSSAFKYAQKELHLIDSNPCNQVSRGTESPPLGRALTHNELDRLSSACKESSSPVIWPIVQVAVTTGARQGEILGLRWNDINFFEKCLIFRDTKNGEDRIVPAFDDTLKTLKKLSKVRRIDTNLVFPNIKGTGPTWITRPWKRVLGDAGITNFNFHGLRHTAITYLSESGASDIEIADVVGHKTLQMVKRYAHPSIENRRKILEQMTTHVFG